MPPFNACKKAAAYATAPVFTRGYFAYPEIPIYLFRPVDFGKVQGEGYTLLNGIYEKNGL